MNPSPLLLWPNEVLRKPSAMLVPAPPDHECKAKGYLHEHPPCCAAAWTAGSTAVNVFELHERLKATCYAANGLGLAAPQIGVSLHVAFVDVGDGKPLLLINPKIEAKEGTFRSQEGCLSIPGCSTFVTRARKVIVSYFREDGTEAEPLAARGLLAVALQHEIDHLDGRCVADEARLLSREAINKIHEEDPLSPWGQLHPWRGAK